jgi:xylulokinase
MSAMHEKKHFLRAVLEGVTYSLRDCVEVLREMDIPLDGMTVVGGGGKSALWREMIAGTFNLPVKTIKNGEGAALGVAILAGVGTGVYESVEAACDKLIAYGEPQLPTDTESYEAFYQIYRSVYPGVKDSFTALANL